MLLVLFLELVLYVCLGLTIMIFETKRPTRAQIVNVILKIVLVDLTSRYIIYNFVLNYFSVSYANLNFNFLEFIVLASFYTIFQDISFHTIHKIIHTNKFYAKIHEMHHRNEITSCSAILGKYMTVSDFVIFACFTNILKILCFQSNVKYMIIVDMLDYVGTLYSHSGIVPNNLKYHHYAHHKYIKCNYGMTPLSDWLFDTLKIDN